jgi:recombination protein RecA
MAKSKKEKPIATSLENLKEIINRQYGDGSVIQGRNSIVAVEIFPTNIATIDLALGVGGMPIGRTLEIFGTESSGKTTTCLQIIAACQKHYFPKKERNGVVAFVDAEHALDPTWATNIGVDMDKLLLSQPNSGEEALNIVEMMAKSKQVDLIVIDSVAALIPKAELEGDIGDHHVGAQARMMSQALRKLVGVALKSQTTIIFINQIREKIGVMFGSPEVTPGGRALKFYASIRAQISKGSAVKDGDVTVGFEPTIKFIKNKVAPPFTSAKYVICAGTPERPVYGIDAAASLIDVAITFKVVARSGSHYKYGKQILGNGMGNASKFLRENPDMFEEIKQKTYTEAFGSIEPIPAQDPEFNIDDELIDAD